MKLSKQFAAYLAILFVSACIPLQTSSVIANEDEGSEYEGSEDEPLEPDYNADAMMPLTFWESVQLQIWVTLVSGTEGYAGYYQADATGDYNMPPEVVQHPFVTLNPMTINNHTFIAVCPLLWLEDIMDPLKNWVNNLPEGAVAQNQAANAPDGYIDVSHLAGGTFTYDGVKYEVFLESSGWTIEECIGGGSAYFNGAGESFPAGCTLNDGGAADSGDDTGGDDTGHQP